jgi:hypothetical protein
VANQPSPIELQKHLGGMEYPASKDALLEHAKSKGAPKEILERLETISDREYDGPNGVVKEFSAG